MFRQRDNRARRGYQSRLVLVIWIAALIPAVLLTLNQLNRGYLNQQELERQELSLYGHELTIDFEQIIISALNSMDLIAAEGSVIRSVTFDILSSRTVQEMQSFLDEHNAFDAVMILDRNAFQLEVIPPSALAYNLEPFQPTFTRLFSDKTAYTNPESRFNLAKSSMVYPDMEASDDYVLSISRPILKARDSFTQPFEVTGVFFTTASLEKLIIEALPESENSLDNTRLTVMHENTPIYSSQAEIEEQNLITYSESITIGHSGLSLALTLVFEQNSHMSLIELLVQQRSELIFTLLLLIALFVAAFRLTRGLVRPLVRLRNLTEYLSKHDFSAENVITIDRTEAYREFQEVNELMLKMSNTIGEQFRELKDYNRVLRKTTLALEESNKASTEQNEILYSLIQFSLLLQNETDIKNVSELTRGMIQQTVNSDTGLLLLRSDYLAGVSLIDNAPETFKTHTENYNLALLDEKDIDEISNRESEFLIEKIFIKGNYHGFIVTDQKEASSFKVHAVTLFLSVYQSEIEQRMLNQKLEKTANSDSLTGLYNRHYFDKHYLELQVLNEKSGNDFSLLMIDVNGLKRVNDDIGHAAGDALIKYVADLLNNLMRKNDIIARTGGDEFVILLENTDSSVCETLVNRLKNASAQHSLNLQNQHILVQYSVGHASSDVDNINSLLDIADMRMYAEKENHYQNTKRR